MELPIKFNILNESPNIDANGDLYTTDISKLNDIVDDIINGNPTSYLISGYRGTGKSSFIEKIRAAILLNKDYSEINNKLIFVNINFPKSITQAHFLRKIIRELYLGVEKNPEFIKLKNKYEEFENFGTLYDRTFNDITDSKINNKTTEYKFTNDIDFIAALIIFTTLISNKISQYINLTDIVWGSGVIISGLVILKNFLKSGFSFTKTSTQKEESNRKSLYDDEIADHHFCNLLKKFKSERFRIVFVFDEIDKLDEQDLKDFMKLVKPYLLSGFANYIVVAGQNLSYEYSNSKYQDDGLLSSMFSRTIHISLLSRTELHEVFDKLIINNELLHSDIENKKHIEYFVDYLIFESKGVSRTFIGLIRRELKWKRVENSKIISREAYLELTSPIENYKIYSKLLGAIDKVYKEEIQIDDFTNSAIADYFKMQLILVCHGILSNKKLSFTKDDVSAGDNINEEFDDFLIQYIDKLFEILIDEKIIAFNSKESSYQLAGNTIVPSVNTNINIYNEITEFKSIVKRIGSNIESIRSKDSSDPKPLELLRQLNDHGNIIIPWHSNQEVINIIENIETHEKDEDTVNRITKIFSVNNVNLSKISFELLQYYSKVKISDFFKKLNYLVSKEGIEETEKFDLYLSNTQNNYPDLIFEYTWRKREVLPFKDSILKSLRYIRKRAQENEICYVFLIIYTDIVETNFLNSHLKFKEQLSEFEEYEEFKNYIIYFPISTHNAHLIKRDFDTFEKNKIRNEMIVPFENMEAPIKHPERNDRFFQTYNIVNKNFDIKIKPIETKYWRMGIEFSETDVFLDNNRGRHKDKNVGYVVLTVGDQEKDKSWVRNGRLDMHEYHIDVKESNFVEIRDYNSGEVDLSFVTDNIENTVTFIIKVVDNELGKITYDLKNYKYFRISAWCDDNNFKLETIISEIHLFNKDRNLVSNFNLLIGTWKNFWSGKDKEDEIFRITSERKYEYLNGKHYFNIDNFNYDPLTKEVYFIKTAMTSVDDRKLENKLYLENMNLLTGTENGSKIKYIKIIS